MDRVVIDTNVWISAALSTTDTPVRIVEKVLKNGTPAFSGAIFDELELRLWKPKFVHYLCLENRRAILRDVKTVAEWVELPAEIRSRPAALTRRTTNSYRLSWRQTRPG